MDSQESGRSEQERLFNIFENLNNKPDYPANKKITKIALLATPRSGSNLFCDVLERTHQFGMPQEWVAKRVINAYAAYFHKKEVDIRSYLNFLLRKTTSENGIFSIKIQVNHYQQLLAQNINILDLKFDRLYYLYRNNKMEQGYSFAKSRITNQWRSDVSSSSRTPEKIRRSFILDSLSFLAGLEEFYQKNLQHLVEKEFCYEEFQHLDKTDSFNFVFDNLGINQKPASWQTALEKMAENRDMSELEDLIAYLIPTKEL